MNDFRSLSVNDVGTRAEHLSDLHDLWAFAFGLLTAGSYHTELEVKQAQELEVALNLLEIQMQTCYDPTSYAQVINKLPDPWEKK